MFEIHTLQIGELRVPHGDRYLRDPIHVWYATDGTTHLLIDSGMPDSDEVTRRMKIPATGGGHASLRQELARVGATPESIDYVLLTHIHFDHGWNLDLFPEACVVVQRDELFHAIDPVATQRIYYFKETLISLLQRKRPSQLRLADGDVDLLDGVRLIKVPGHTPGMQAVIITTQRGKVALVSDLGDHYRYWHPADPRANDRPMRYMAGSFLPGVIRSESEITYVQSMAKVRAQSDIIVPAHDFRVPRVMPRDWYDIPDASQVDLTRETPA